MDTTITLTDELRAKIIAKLEKMGPPKIDWDHRDEIDTNQIVDAMEKNPECPLYHLQDEISERNFDYSYDLEMEHLEYVLDYFGDEISEHNDIDQDDLNIKELANELREDFLDYLSVDPNVKQLLGRANINLRVSMYSNYDCINSHWLESQEGYQMESYFGDMVRQLKLNPAKVKAMLLEHGHKTYGPWPKMSDKNALVSYEDFYTELENTSCGANLLTYVGQVDAYEFMKMDHTKPMTVTIGKNSHVGLFSSFQGGGSIIDMKLLQPVTIEIGKALDDSGYLKYGLEIDDPKSDYSIANVYGVSNSFWDGEFTIEQR